jgi:GDP-L-fucose synthase
MEKNSNILVAGRRGLVGSENCRRLHEEGFDKLVSRELKELELRDQAATRRFIADEKPNASFWRPPKWAGFWPIPPTRPISFRITSRWKPP